MAANALLVPSITWQVGGPKPLDPWLSSEVITGSALVRHAPGAYCPKCRYVLFVCACGAQRCYCPSGRSSIMYLHWYDGEPHRHEPEKLTYELLDEEPTRSSAHSLFAHGLAPGIIDGRAMIPVPHVDLISFLVIVILLVAAFAIPTPPRRRK